MANQALRQEIGLMTLTIFGSGTVTSSDISQLDTGAYSTGTAPTYWFEAVYNGAASNTGTIALRDIAAATNVASLSGATSTTHAINRVQFTPTAGAREYTVQIIGDGVRVQNLFEARIIVLQNEASITKTQTQISIGSWSNNLANTSVADVNKPKFWKYNSANWDGTKAFSVEVVYTTTAKNTATITLCRTSDNAANVTVVNAGSNSTGFVRTRVAFTPVNGETYKLRSVGSTTKSQYSIFTAKIIVDQSVNPTKFEPQQCLLLGTTVSGTGAQGLLTTYNSSEWNVGSGSLTITHLIDSDNASNSAKVVTAAGADTGSSSTATGVGQIESGAFTLIDATNYDVNVLNATTTLSASRLKFVYVFAAAAGRRIFVTGG